MSENTPTPIADALHKPIDIPTDIEPNTVTIAGTAREGGDVGVTVDANVHKDIGKPGGWEADVGARASWWKSIGGSVMGYLRLGKSKN